MFSESLKSVKTSIEVNFSHLIVFDNFYKLCNTWKPITLISLGNNHIFFFGNQLNILKPIAHF